MEELTSFGLDGLLLVSMSLWTSQFLGLNLNSFHIHRLLISFSLQQLSRIQRQSGFCWLAVVRSPDF